MAELLPLKVSSFILRYTLFKSIILLDTGGPVAQWVKHWPTDLAVPGLIPA